MTRPPGTAVWPVVVVLSMAGVLVSLQGTLLLPLVPIIPDIYGITPVDASWMVTSTLLAGAVATPVVTRLADLRGKRPVIIWTLAVMMLGSVLIAVFDNYLVAIVGRVMQGSATALIPVAMSVMKDVLPRDRVAFGVAMVSASLGIGAAVGLPLAGILYSALGWQSMFWLTAGLSPLLILGVWRLLPAVHARSSERFDWLGAVLLVGALVPLLLVITQGNEWGWLSSRSTALWTLAAVAAAAWVAWERRARDPLISLRLAALPPVLLTNVATLVIAVGMLANLLIASQQLGTPTFVAGGFGLTPGVTGLVMAAPPALLVLGAPVTGMLLARLGGRTVLLVGTIVMSLSYVARVFLDDSVAEVAIGATLVGAGTGLSVAAIPLIIMESVPARQTASANGVNTLFRMLGLAVSTAGLAALAAATSTQVGGREYPTVRTIHLSLWICAAATFVAVVVIWFIPSGESVRGRRGVSSEESRGVERYALIEDSSGISVAYGAESLAENASDGYGKWSNSLFRGMPSEAPSGDRSSPQGHVTRKRNGR